MCVLPSLPSRREERFWDVTGHQAGTAEPIFPRASVTFQASDSLFSTSLGSTWMLQCWQTCFLADGPFWMAGAGVSVPVQTAAGSLSPRCDDHCSACEGSSGNCLKCKEGFSLLGGSCVTNETCTNGKWLWRNSWHRSASPVAKMRGLGDSLHNVELKALQLWGLPGARLLQARLWLQWAGGLPGRAAGYLPIAQMHPSICVSV